MTVIRISWEPEAITAAVKGRYGRSTSLKWPWLYDKLRAKGYDKSKAAAISNSRLRYRKTGRLNVLKATQAHNPKVLAKIRKADKVGKHVTAKALRASAQMDRLVELACHSKSCAPPPAGQGGSLRGPSGPAHPGPNVHSLGIPHHVPVSGRDGYHHVYDEKGTYQGMSGTEQANRYVKGRKTTLKAVATRQRAKAAAAKPTVSFKVITAAQARGDSRPVSHAEFQRLATIGQAKLDKLSADHAPATGLNEHWGKIKSETFLEVQKSWGGATIDSHTGQALPQGTHKYALTIKEAGMETISVHKHATEAEFSAAMDRAKTQFKPILERQGSHLGVFHDDENNRIDIDPVLVVTDHADVETIGAATHAIGGAYNFADGNGYWPPHVAEG